MKIDKAVEPYVIAWYVYRARMNTNKMVMYYIPKMKNLLGYTKAHDMSDKYIVSKHRYWEKLIDEYYDEYYWNHCSDKDNIYTWVDKKYGAVTDIDSAILRFSDPKQYTWFCLQKS